MTRLQKINGIIKKMTPEQKEDFNSKMQAVYITAKKKTIKGILKSKKYDLNLFLRENGDVRIIFSQVLLDEII